MDSLIAGDGGEGGDEGDEDDEVVVFGRMTKK